MVTNIENLVYDKKIYYKKKNVVTKYAKFCIEVNCKKYTYYNFENENKKLYCRQHKKDNMISMLNRKIKNNNKCKYLNCKKIY